MINREFQKLLWIKVANLIEKESLNLSYLSNFFIAGNCDRDVRIIDKKLPTELATILKDKAVRVEYLTVSEIMERYGDQLSEEQLTQLKDKIDASKND